MLAGVSFYGPCFNCRTGLLDQVVLSAWPYVIMPCQIQNLANQTCASDHLCLSLVIALLTQCALQIDLHVMVTR